MTPHIGGYAQVNDTTRVIMNIACCLQLFLYIFPKREPVGQPLLVTYVSICYTSYLKALLENKW